jgi:cutinase
VGVLPRRSWRMRGPVGCICWIGRATLLAVAAALLASVGGVVWVKAAPPPSAETVRQARAAAERPCTDVELIGLRGSGDPEHGSAGLGADVFALAWRVRQAVAASRFGSLDVYALPYEQGDLVLGAPVSVPRDIAPGAALLDSYLDARAAACPSERKVVVGQSEGAAVAHWAYPATAKRLRALVLLGDPFHLRDTVYDQYLGPAGDGQLTPWLGLDLRSRHWGDPITASDAVKVRSFCLPHDQVCSLDPFDHYPTTHLSYRHNPAPGSSTTGVLERAAGFLLARLSS